MTFEALEELEAADLNDMLDRLAALETLQGADDRQTTSGTTTSTSYTATLTGVGAVACGIAFEAPASGKVIVHNACNIVNSGAGNLTFCTIKLRTGAVVGSGSDGPDQPADLDDDAIQHPGTSDSRAGSSRLFEGLTAGAAYNVQQMFRVAAGTGTFSKKSLVVQGVR